MLAPSIFHSKYCEAIMTINPVRTAWVKRAAIVMVAGGIGVGTYLGLTATQQPQTAIAPQVTPQLISQSMEVSAFRSPTCGCCGAWLDHMKSQGFKVKDHLVEDMEGIKREHNIPSDLTSCHTAIVGGYVVEGHIPAADVIRLLSEQPAIAGIAVPGMPIGSPGMESGNRREPYTVFSFTADGEITTFQEHTS